MTKQMPEPVAISVEDHIAFCSMRPQPGTPTGRAWEDGARQGWEWAIDRCIKAEAERDRLLAGLREPTEEMIWASDSTKIWDSVKCRCGQEISSGTSANNRLKLLKAMAAALMEAILDDRQTEVVDQMKLEA